MTDSASLFDRTRLLLGEERLARLKRAHVFIAGLGGVGGHAAEALVRAGVGSLSLVDADTVNATNLNRQWVASCANLGRLKVDIAREKLLDINPDVHIAVYPVFLRDAAIGEFLDSAPFSYGIDAIDSLSPKAFLIQHAHARGIPLISALGTAGKWDPSRLKITTLDQTAGCPLAKALRKRLLRLGGDLSRCRTVFSDEVPFGEVVVNEPGDDPLGKRSNRGTISYLPAMAGMMAASFVIRSLCAE